MKNILILLSVFVFFTSCEEVEPTYFDLYSDYTYASFVETYTLFPVPTGGTASIEIEIGTTTLSESDRILVIGVDEESTTANSDNYHFETTDIVIPANEHIGTIVLHGEDVNIDPSGERVYIKIISMEGAATLSEDTHEVIIFRN